MAIVRFLNKLFNIRTDEWSRVLLLFSMAFLTNAGTVWGLTIVYAAFLKQVGLAMLPLILVFSSVLSIIATAIYTAFVDRIANDRLHIIIFAVMCVGVVMGLGMLWLGHSEQAAYPFLCILILVWITVVNPHQITYINSFYDIQSAKRVLPVVTAGYRVGAIVAGLTIPLLTARLASSDMILLIWLAAHAAVIGLTVLMPHLQRDQPQPGLTVLATPANSDKQRASYLDNMREGFRYTAQSAFLRWMAIGTLLMMALMALIEYRSSQLLLSIYGTPKELASYMAVLVGVANIVILPMLLFGMSRLITLLGVGNASLIFPAGNLVICGGLILEPGLASASAAYLDRTALRIAFQYPIDGLLYNAVPLRMKGRARAFVGGLIVPVGSLIGGVVLLLPFKNAAWFVPTLIGILAAAYLISAWLTRQQYSLALVKMLQQEDYSFLLSQEASDLTVADPATLAQLQKKLEESKTHEITVFIAKLISQVGGSKAIPILAAAARSAAEARTRSAMIDILVAADLHDDALHQLYSDLLADPDGQVRQSAMAGLEELAGPTDKQFLSKMLEMVQDSDIGVRSRALAAIAHSGDFYQFTPAAQALDQLLNGESPGQRVQGVRLLGLICQVLDSSHESHRADAASKEKARTISDYIHTSLIDYLDDPADEVRLETALAVETLSFDALPTQLRALSLEKMSHLLHDPIERVRQSALVVLGRAGTQESYQAIVDALADPSYQVRATAVNTLAQTGKSVIPLVHPKLDSPDSRVRKMAAVILSRVDPKEFGPLIIGTYVTGNLLAVYRNYGLVEVLTPCAKYPSMGILQCALREQNQQLVDEIFYLLTAIHEPGAVKIIGESLHSESAHTRANATEALEALTTPQIARLVAPLFEPGLPPAQLLVLSQEAWKMEHPGAAQAIRQLAVQPDSPLLRAITTFALGEMGAVLASQAHPPAETKTESQLPAASQPEGRKARRSALTDLLGALTDTAPDASPHTPAGEAKPERKPRRTSDLLGALADTAKPEAKESKAASDKPTATPAPADLVPILLSDIQAMLQTALADPIDEVRRAAQVAQQALEGAKIGGLKRTEEVIVLSTIEKIIFLKEVPFFQGMTIEQLKVLANVCEEALFEKDTRIYNNGDPGGVLYVVVSGRVGIEQEKRTGSFARLANIEAHSYFGEMNLFDNSSRSTSAVALQDTLTLRLRREPLIALARQHPDLSLELINVLSQRLRDTSDRIAELTRTRPRELHKLFDQFD